MSAGADAELVQIASDVWALHEAFTMEMMTAYRDELTKQALQRDREREMLLGTLETYFAAQGSAVEAGKRLYCHPNTVRHRLHRIERQTVRLLQDPRSCVELLIALEALRTLPGRSRLGEVPHRNGGP